MPIDWLTLCATVFALGLRHGLDADHLAAIDGMTRFNHGACRPMARWCGALFSVGHGAVVILVAATAGAAVRNYAIPPWATKVGEWASIGVLLSLGILNLVQLRAPTGRPLAPVGLQGRLLSRLTRTANPVSAAAVGALFALSFDTLSQALLFSATAARFQGWRSALILGALFAFGMLLLDGLNGACLARLLNRADATAKAISRGLGMVVAVLSLVVGAAGALRLLSPRLNDTIESQTGFLGVVLISAVVASAGLLALWQPARKIV
jgi:high-affinity nickel-transport protein